MYSIICWYCFTDGDLGAGFNVRDAFMKQKHRLLWERRHGPVGSGMKKDPYEVEADEH